MAASGNPRQSSLAVDAGQTGAEGATPVCYIIEDDARVRHFLSLILHGAGVDAVDFVDGKSFRNERLMRAGEIVFLNVNENAGDAIVTLRELSQSRFAGKIQLMASERLDVVDNLRLIGEQQNLRMLPLLKKPFEGAAIKKILEAENLGDRPAIATKVRLDEALKNGWIETWYQPKINLGKKQLAGAEAFARVRHPDYGVLAPGAFMPDAAPATLLVLAEHTLEHALKTGLELSRLGVNLRIAVNMDTNALENLPVVDIVRRYRPQAGGWSGLIVDVSEEQIVANFRRIGEIARALQDCNVKLAIDDFGRGVSSVTKFMDIPFAEMKLDRMFVSNCGVDEVHAAICRSAIELAHSFGSTAVGIGVEKAADLTALTGMGCDLGQGFLLGQPMAEERFSALLKQRAANTSIAAPSPRR